MIGLHLLIAILLGRRRQVLTGLIIGSSLILGTAKATPYSPSPQRGDQAAQRLQDWQSLIARSLRLSDGEKQQAVNEFFNRQIRFGEDQEVWGQPDYWASPLETLARGAGDCEDFALAKYYSLRLLGIAEQRLRLVYTTLSSTGQAHMVLGYWPDDGAAVLLDNLHPAIQPMIRRQDLQPQFAFGVEHLYRVDHSRLTWAGDAQRLPSWQAVQARVRQQSSVLPTVVLLASAAPLRPKGI